MSKKKRKYGNELWERRADLAEGSKAYRYFCAYRDMQRPLLRSNRSLRECAKTIGVSDTLLEDLSVKYQWAARVAAYDDYMECKTREENEAAIIKMKQTHADLAIQLLVKATKRLMTLPDNKISAKDVVMMIDTGVKVERLSRGESTENRQVQGEIKGELRQHHDGVMATLDTAVDLTKLTDAELDAFERLCQKIQAKSADDND